MANYTLTTGTDIFPGTASADNFYVTPNTLTAGDSIGTAGQTDTIQMNGDGTYDFRPVTVAGIATYNFTGTNVTIYAPSNSNGAIFYLGNSGSALYGGAGAERVSLARFVTDGADLIDLGDGNDTITADAAYDFLGDTLIGGGGDDSLILNGPNFDLTRAASISGIETVTMTIGGSTLTVGSNTLSDVVTINGTSGADVLRLAASFSTLNLSGTTLNSVEGITLQGGGSTLTLGSVPGGLVSVTGTGVGNKLVVTSGGINLDNLFVSNIQTIQLTDSAGAYLVDSSAARALQGGAGADTLTGGGADTLTGGSGLDTFANTSANFNGVTITDLDIGESIVVSNLAFGTGNVSLSGSVLSFGASSMTLQGLNGGALALAAASGGAGTRITLTGKPGTPDLAPASDLGGSSTDGVTNASALTFTGAGTATTAGSTVSVFLDKNNNNVYDAGVDVIGSAAVQSNGSWEVQGLSTTGLNGQYNVYAFARSTASGYTSALSAAQTVTIDTSAPTAGTPVRADLVAPSGTSFTVSVTYADSGSGIDLSTVGTTNITVTGPAGALTVTGFAVSGNEVTYTVAAPGGSWDMSDAGSYIVGINASVRDLAGNTVAANASAHSFTVSNNTAPELGGTFATPTIDDTADVSPFSGVTVTDADGDTLTVTISYTAANGTLSGAGLSGSAGNYTLTGSAAAVQAALQALQFTPTENQIASGTTDTTFTLSLNDGVDTATSSATVVHAAPVAPSAIISLSDTSLTRGETATLTVTFSEAVTGFNANLLTVQGGTIDALTSSNGGVTWTATFTPTPNRISNNNQISLDLTGVSDAGGTAGSGSAHSVNYTINTSVPLQVPVNQTVSGSASNDVLTGGSGHDLLIGAGGNDTLLGGAGDDVLLGGSSDAGNWTFYVAADGKLTASHSAQTLAKGQTMDLANLNLSLAELAFLNAPTDKLVDLTLLYSAAFGRMGDLAGVNHHLESGASMAQVARGFTASAEWDAAGWNALSDTAYVQKLYQQVLGRTGDAAELAFWSDQLSSNGAAQSRADVLLAFATSAEHRALRGDGIAGVTVTLNQDSGWIAGSGNDRLEGGAGNDRLVGGDGTDTVVYRGAAASYGLALNSNGEVMIVEPDGARDTILQIEQGEFDGVTRNLGFTQASASTLKEIGMLYQLTLDRAGDFSGFEFWVNTGLKGSALAAGFMAAPEFQQRYSGLGDVEFISALYQNTVGEGPDAATLAQWDTYLDTHTRADLVAQLATDVTLVGSQFGTGGMNLIAGL